MEQYSIISYVAAWLATVALVFVVYHLRRRPTMRFNLPPGPKPWPIIGNLHLMGPLPHRSVHELSKQYGQIMHLKFGSKSIVVGSSVDMAKVFLKTMDINFACRPKFVAGKYTAYNYSDIVWSPYGPSLRQARKMCVVELFSARRLDSYEYIREEEKESLINVVHKSSGEEIVLKDLLLTLTLNVITRMVLGKKLFDETEVVKPMVSGEEFQEMINEWLLLNGVLNIGDWIPWIGFMDLQGYVKRMKALSKKLDIFLEHVLNQRDKSRLEAGNFVPKDMVDLLLQIHNDTSTLDFKLDRNSVKGITMDLLTGGTETSVVTLEWSIAHLLRKPEIFKTATDELDKVIGPDRWVEEKDMNNLPYIRAIVKETLRLHPLTPMLTPRRAREDCNVGGYDIPKDTIIQVNVWSIGRDPMLWDKPEEFCPERFIGNEMDVKGNHFELLPFGAGRRMCPGYPLGLKVIESTLANLLHGFNWKLPSKMTGDDLKMDEIYGLSTHMKFPLVTVAHPRLPLEMYSF